MRILKPNIQKLILNHAITENALTEGAKNELKKTKEIQKMVKREKS